MKGENKSEVGGDANVEPKSHWRPSQSRKESILNYFLIGNRGFIYKSKEGIGSRKMGLLEEGEIIGGKEL